MPKRQVFYSFHYDNDVMRVAQIRNIGALEDNKPVSPADWESVKRGGAPAIKKWINDNMNYRSCVVVFIGSQTAQRPWVDYEICKAWDDGKGVLGVYIHNIKCPRNGTCTKGANPFENISFKNGSKMSSVVKCYDPRANDAYGDIATNLETWVEAAIAQRG